MNLLLPTILLFAFVVSSVAEGDPRAVTYIPGFVAEGNHIATDTSKSIVVFGARDDEGLYSVQGVNRRFSLDELEKLLVTFFREFPTDAKSDAKGFTGLPVSKPNVLYKSLSWAETKSAGRDLVTEVAKSANVSLYFFTINPNYSAAKRKGVVTPDASTAVIDYYDSRLATTVTALWPENRNPESKAPSQ